MWLPGVIRGGWNNGRCGVREKGCGDAEGGSGGGGSGERLKKDVVLNIVPKNT